MLRMSVIRNPASGRGKRVRQWGRIAAELRQLGAEVIETDYPGHASQIASQLDGIVVAAGGDGTINEVLRGMGPTSTLGLIPMGTGNDLCRSLRITADNAIDVLKAGATQEIDVWQWSTGEGSGRFVNVAGCGFDAAVADRINHGVKWLTGTPAYVYAVVATLLGFRPAELRITVGEEEIESRLMLCALANATCYGGGMKVAPNAQMNDGLLDIVMVRELSRLGFLKAFPKVFSGQHVGHPAVTILKANRASIASIMPLPVLADGELVGTTPLAVSLCPDRLRVISPPNAEETCPAGQKPASS
jgi:diacylglycerol kinase (ATP)